MNFLVHMSAVVVMDYAIFRYWYTIANRYVVLNYHETGFLPARYIISGLVAGVFVYWLYLIPVATLTRFQRKYKHPDWIALWLATTMISSIQTVITVRSDSQPPLTLAVTAALVVHLQVLHLIMFRTAALLKHEPRRLVTTGVSAGVLFMIDWLFWLWYSFEVTPAGSPHPAIGSVTERYILMWILGTLIVVGVLYLSRIRLPYISRRMMILPDLNVTLGDLLHGFYSAWALYYWIVPMAHYLLRGYIIAHSYIYPSILPWLLAPLLWSLGFMWVLIWLRNPWVMLRMPRLNYWRGYNGRQ